MARWEPRRPVTAVFLEVLTLIKQKGWAKGNRKFSINRAIDHVSDADFEAKSVKQSLCNSLGIERTAAALQAWNDDPNRDYPEVISALKKVLKEHGTEVQDDGPVINVAEEDVPPDVELTYYHTAEMGEISGFGGSYELSCQIMLDAGVKWLNENAEPDLKAYSLKNVFGLITAESEDAKTLMDVIAKAADDAVPDGGVTGAMVHALMNRLFWIAKNGWDKYVEELSKPKEPNPDGHVYEPVPHSGNNSVLCDDDVLPLCLEIRNHSPTGFNWGYLGSGPAQLALAIMVKEYGKDLDEHPCHYQEFKTSVIANLPQGNTDWKLTSKQIREAIETIKQTGVLGVDTSADDKPDGGDGIA